MCATCGCDTGAVSTIHHHGHDQGLTPEHEHRHHKTLVDVEQDVLHQNDLLAQRNRGYFDAKNILTLNLVSSPGSGKTSLLERTLIDLKNEMQFAVIEGDQQTTNDADRIHATGTKVTQINTGKGCHLDAHMIYHAVHGMKLKENQVLFIENVGNLVCPAMFDLGENERVVIISVTEGDDKPLKYPDMFHTSTLCIINKIDLLPYVPFSMAKVKENAKKINPGIEFRELSCTSGEGLESWYSWLRSKILVPQEA
ncbi:MAG TPA: hydrogenase nickel incorporation protein HypB [Saprospiraceae bacterium]|nr:hydrogenase nickel incorporation protein HypB [Saprospiraceae bacterium]